MPASSLSIHVRCLQTEQVVILRQMTGSSRNHTSAHNFKSFYIKMVPTDDTYNYIYIYIYV